MQILERRGGSRSTGSPGSWLHRFRVGLLVVITAAIWTGCSSTGGKPDAGGDGIKSTGTTPTPAAKESTPAGSGETTPAPPARAEPAPAKAAPAPVGSPEYWTEQIRELEKNLKPLRSIAVPASPAKSRADLVSASLNRG